MFSLDGKCWIKNILRLPLQGVIGRMSLAEELTGRDKLFILCLGTPGYPRVLQQLLGE